MPSKRKQLNFRVDDESQAELERLKEVIAEQTGLEISYSDVFRLAIRELSKKYPPEKKGGQKS